LINEEKENKLSGGSLDSDILLGFTLRRSEVVIPDPKTHHDIDEAFKLARKNKSTFIFLPFPLPTGSSC